MRELTPADGTVVALDCDGTLLPVGEVVAPPVTLERLRQYRHAGGRVALLSGRGEPHLRATLSAAQLDLGIGECGYLFVELSANRSELMIPKGFRETFISADLPDPVAVMTSLGIPDYLISLHHNGLAVMLPHRNTDRRVTYCCKALRAYVDLAQLQEEVASRFGPEFVLFRNGQIDTVTLQDGSSSAVDTIHVAPRDHSGNGLFGKAHGLSALAERIGVPLDRVHFGGDSLHDLDAGIATAVRLFGVANCDEPNRWQAAGASVTRSRHGYGVAEYIEETFALPNSVSISSIG